MALNYVDVNGILTIPGAYASYTVQTANAGLAATGILLILGEASQGPSYSQETNGPVAFGPDQFAAVSKKYGSGDLVDAFRTAAAPSSDPQIRGAPTAIYLLKTNTGTKATASMLRAGLSAYATLEDISYGLLGNQIYSSVVNSTPEVPAQFQGAYVPPVIAASTWALQFRLNGGSSFVLSGSGATYQTPTALMGAINASSTTGNSLAFAAAAYNIFANGGLTRGLLISGNVGVAQLAVAVSGNTATFTISNTGTGGFAALPVVGDVLQIPVGSAIAGTGNANCGTYIVSTVGAAVISALKVANAVAPGSPVTAPVVVAATNVLATTDLQAFSPITFANFTGVNRGSTVGLGAVTVTGTISGAYLVLTLGSGSWVANPQTGDYCLIAGGASAPAVIANAAGGWYTVVSSTNNTVTLSRLSSDRAATAFVATALGSSTEIQFWRPAIDGVGKSIEVFTDSSNTSGLVAWYDPATSAPAQFDTSSGAFFTSATELGVTLNVARPATQTNEVIPAGGAVVLTIGYKGTSCSVTVTGTTLTTTPVGGSGSALSILFSQYATLAGLAGFINSQPGYTCSVGSNLYGQYAPSILDDGTFTCGTGAINSNQTLRLKADAYFFNKAITQNSGTVMLANPLPVSGLPEPQSTFYLVGGTQGGTSNTDILNALNAYLLVQGNFVIPLFSQDATLDIAQGQTDPASTYTIAAIQALTLQHVQTASQYKNRKPRQGFASNLGTFAAAKTAAQTMATARMSMTFQSVKTTNTYGNIVLFQPWMLSVFAAGMQAAGFYRPLFNKLIDASGIIQVAGDFSDQSQSNVSDALNNGLLVAQNRVTGGITFVSDQTTYGVDNNFVYNSIQAIYAADTVATTTAQRMEVAFVGQSFSDVSAAVALSYLKGIMADLLRLKLLTPSDDAPNGYKNVNITIAPPVMLVSLEIKLGTGIYFIPISFLISQASQTATA